MKKIRLSLVLMMLLFVSCMSYAQVGINTTTPLSMLDVNGNMSVKVVNLSGNGTGNSGAAVNISDGIYISITPVALMINFSCPIQPCFPEECISFVIFATRLPLS